MTKKIQAWMKQYFHRSYTGSFAEFLDDWKWIFSFSKRFRGIILLFTATGIFGSTMSLVSAYISRILINIIVNRQTDKLWLLIGAMLGSLLFSMLLSSVNSRISAKISIYVNNTIQGEIFDRIIDARWKELSAYPSGDLLNRFNSDVGTVASNAVSWIPNVIINVYTFVITFFALFRTDPNMAWIAFFAAPFLLLASRFILRRMREYRKRVLELSSQMMSFEVETFYNFDTIKSFGVFDYYSRKLRAWQQKFKEYHLDYSLFEIKSRILLDLISSFVAMVAFGYALFRLWTGQILYGDMTFFLQQRSSLTARFNSLVSTIPGMLNSAVSAHRIRELMELPKEVHDPASYEKLEQLAAGGITVSMQDVSFGYSEDRRVYEHADFLARPGEIVAVLAESGGGKSTLMHLMLGMLDPDSGSVTLTASNGESLPMNADLRRLFAYVPQGNTILSGSIADNMRLVREDVSEEEIVAALKTACAWDFVSKLPEGIHTKLGERGRGISEGQAQRLSIARALIRNSPILLLDEATSALDLDTEQAVLQSIVLRHPNKLIVISTHRPGALRLCQRLYRISDGAIRETTLEEAEKTVLRYVPSAAPRRAVPPVMHASEDRTPDEMELNKWWNQ